MGCLRWLYGTRFCGDDRAGGRARTMSNPVPRARTSRGEGLPVRTFGGGQVLALAFSPDGRLLAEGGRGGSSIQLIQTGTWQVLRTLEGHADAVTSVAFHPDGQSIASGSTGGPHREIDGHRWSVACVAFSPRGDLLVSGSWDQKNRIWTVPDGKLVHTLDGHVDHVLSVAFSPGGSSWPRRRWTRRSGCRTRRQGERCAPCAVTLRSCLRSRSAPTARCLSPGPRTRRPRYGRCPPVRWWAP
ncbi:MAG TPA: hypothetical protein ENN53_05315 [Candidatus Acetothermia bacterium]|nr:hypothetical protein [Candidatus Acetothermia bacterium]